MGHRRVRRPGGGQALLNVPAANPGAPTSQRGWRPCCPIRFYDSYNSNYLNSRVYTLTRRMRLVDIP